jgi:hypothetical protein
MPNRSNQSIEQDQPFQSDHDVLLELRSDFRNFKEVVTGGLRGVQDSLDSQHAQMNARLIILETFVTKNNLEEKVRRWDSSTEWAESFRGRWKWMIASVSLGSGVLVYFFDHILPNIRLK